MTLKPHTGKRKRPQSRWQKLAMSKLHPQKDLLDLAAKSQAPMIYQCQWDIARDMCRLAVGHCSMEEGQEHHWFCPRFQERGLTP